MKRTRTESAYRRIVSEDNNTPRQLVTTSIWQSVFILCHSLLGKANLEMRALVDGNSRPQPHSCWGKLLILLACPFVNTNFIRFLAPCVFPPPERGIIGVGLIQQFLNRWPFEQLRLGCNCYITHRCLSNATQNSRRRRTPQNQKTHKPTCCKSKLFSFKQKPSSKSTGVAILYICVAPYMYA